MLEQFVDIARQMHDFIKVGDGITANNQSGAKYWAKGKRVNKHFPHRKDTTENQRNSVCNCGSGLKFKKCCINKEK